HTQQLSSLLKDYAPFATEPGCRLSLRWHNRISRPATGATSDAGQTPAGRPWRAGIDRPQREPFHPAAFAQRAAPGLLYRLEPDCRGGNPADPARLVSHAG